MFSSWPLSPHDIIRDYSLTLDVENTTFNDKKVGFFYSVDFPLSPPFTHSCFAYLIKHVSHWITGCWLKACHWLSGSGAFPCMVLDVLVIIRYKLRTMGFCKNYFSKEKVFCKETQVSVSHWLYGELVEIR